MLSEKLRIFSGNLEPYSELEMRVLKYADEAQEMERNARNEVIKVLEMLLEDDGLESYEQKYFLNKLRDRLDMIKSQG